MLSVRFWGVRGSIPCPGPDTYVFGGNTSCLEIRAGKSGDPSNRIVIVDCGTGIRLLGERMLNKNYLQPPINADVLITHTHWDHIMGLPMFAPLFVSGSTLRIRGPVSSEGDTLESIIGDQLSHKYWPVKQSELAADITYDQITETELDLGDGLKVITKYMNHPLLCLGYRFEYQGKSIVTAYDHEPFRNIFQTDPGKPGYDELAASEGVEAADDENQKILNFFQNADILIHDTQYEQNEYDKHIGWGHSSYESAIAEARKASVSRLVLFHHDPNRSDRQLEDLETYYKKAAPGMEITMAKEGLVIEA